MNAGRSNSASLRSNATLNWQNPLVVSQSNHERLSPPPFVMSLSNHERLSPLPFVVSLSNHEQLSPPPFVVSLSNHERIRGATYSPFDIRWANGP